MLAGQGCGIGWSCLPGLLGNPGPALLPDALLLLAVAVEAALLAPLLLVPPEATAQPLFGQTVFMWLTTSAGDMPYLSWTKASTETKLMPAAFPAARSCGNAPAQCTNLFAKAHCTNCFCNTFLQTPSNGKNPD